MSDETQKIERAVPFAVRAYPSDKLFFQEACVKFENQQTCFKAFTEAFKNKSTTNTPELVENPAIDSLIIELSEKNTLIDELTAKIEGLTQQLTEAETKLNNPLLVEIDEPAALAMRKVRPFVIKSGIIKKPDNYRNEFATLATKFLLNKEYSNYL